MHAKSIRNNSQNGTPSRSTVPTWGRPPVNFIHCQQPCWNPSHAKHSDIGTNNRLSTARPHCGPTAVASDNRLACIRRYIQQGAHQCTSSHVKSIFAGYYIVPLQLICRHHGQYSETHHHGVHHTTGEQHLNKIRAECAQCTAIA
jgi:hypothetical protein